MRIARELGNEEPMKIRLCIRFLHQDEYIDYIRDQNGRAVKFSLSHQGMHWHEFRRMQRQRFCAEHCVELAAALIALASLILSLCNAYRIG